jgi:hypothetical protein
MIAWRAFFGTKHAQWMSLTAAEKWEWERATRLLHMYMTGKNFFLHCALKPDWAEAYKVEAILGITLHKFE